MLSRLTNETKPHHIGLDEGLLEAKQSGMPVMLVVHTDWCGNCQKLNPTYGANKLAQLSPDVNSYLDQTTNEQITYRYRVSATGGAGQTVARTSDELRQALAF